MLPGMENEPLVYTIKGNLPVSSLTYRTDWVVNEGFIKFTETYLDGDEVVKESAHVYDRRGVNALGAVETF
jgi:hypothetical protein